MRHGTGREMQLVAGALKTVMPGGGFERM